MNRFGPACRHALLAACCLHVATCVVVPERADLDHRPGQRDLAFVHVPFNFGHTVELHAYFSKSVDLKEASKQIFEMGTSIWKQPIWARWGGEHWAKLNAALLVDSEVTGCPLYFTPPKYWPTNIAEAYFKGKRGFGLLRDPAERLVAMFRGNMPFYGGGKKHYFETCDVNGAIEDMMKETLKGRADPSNKHEYYGKACTRIQQAEYFEGDYGTPQIVVDNRAFPHSVNKVLKDHGYIHSETPDDQWYIEDKRIMHVKACNEVGAWNLTAATRALIKQAYAKDYELLCKTFNYCDENENTCLTYVDEMCPSWVDKTALRAKLFSP